MLYHIVTSARNYVIGKGPKIPWFFPEEREYFKKLIRDGTVIMGRKAYEHLETPSSSRKNFVLSKTRPAGGKNPRYFNSLGDALTAVKTKQVFIGGGAEIYRQTLAFVDGVYLTRIHADYEGDVFYPPLPPSFTERSCILLREDPKIEAFFYENTAGRCGCGGSDGE